LAQKIVFSKINHLNRLPELDLEKCISKLNNMKYLSPPNGRLLTGGEDEDAKNLARQLPTAANFMPPH